ncbi:class I SAM-dependent methyltransferase [Bosea psychrotolerans]|uniref:Methyltransferase family protein n=1 Tax=Bosea psychrotolerans TaxID=1871628 RepID=A0A2S4MGU1_9HYPH|nr:class I SAM-dependent methyltransferase [Bosea psychrotolerans]POR53940.1 methyltransferase family protein [Bosea psychrotolerans]
MFQGRAVSIIGRLTSGSLRYEWIHVWCLLKRQRLINIGLLEDGATASPDHTHAGCQSRSLRLYERLVQEYVDAAPASASLDILEIGCGRGFGLEHIAKRLSQSRVTGIDLSYAASLAGRLSGLNIRRGRYEALPFADCSFDAIVAIEALLYGGIAAGLQEAQRVLKPGGHLLLAQFMKGGIDEVRHGVEGVLKEHGFSVVSFVDLTASARGSVLAGEQHRRRQARHFPAWLRGHFDETLALAGSNRYEGWLNGRYCYFAAIVQAP